MPPRGRGGRRFSRTSIGKASELMGPPPAPSAANQPGSSMQDGKPETGMPEDPLSQKILGPEVKKMKERLIDSATIMAQLVNHHTDVHKVGVHRQAPYPPRALRESWLRQSELYEEIIDTVEIQLRHALAAVDHHIEQEQEKLKMKAQAEDLQKNGTTPGGKARKQSLFIDIPRFDEMAIDPLAVHPEINLNATKAENADSDMHDGVVLTEEPASMLDGTDDGSSKIPSGAVVPKDTGLLRPSRSSISLTSLNRHGLKLDLSSLTMDSLGENKSTLVEPRVSALGGMSAIKGIGSPVTLAPKSARPRPEFDGDFPMGLGQLSQFLSSTADFNLKDLFGDDEMPFTDSVVGNASGSGGAGAAAALESFLSSRSLLQSVKAEDVSIDLLGPSNHVIVVSEAAAQDKLFEELGLVEVKNKHAATASTSGAPVNLNADLSPLGGDGGIGIGIGSFEFSNASAGTGSTNFDMIDLEEVQRMQQQQQRQQFGLDLLPTTIDEGGGGGPVDSKMLDQYQQLLENTGGDVNQGTDFNFTDLLGGVPGENSTSAGVDDFNALFDDATGTDDKSA